MVNLPADPFNGNELRLARLTCAWPLEELAVKVGATRQYIHQLETGAKLPTQEMKAALADALGVQPSFFASVAGGSVKPEQCHFRPKAATPQFAISQVLARGSMLDRLASELDKRLSLPQVNFPDIPVASSEDVELAAEAARRHWGLGGGPIVSMMRVVENAGAIVTYFKGLSEKVDALSMDRPRPIIVRSDAKGSLCRLRFDLAHECGHLIMHRGIETGDRVTEEQAHRFASAFLMPRAAFYQEYPRGRNHNWRALFALKLRWKVAVRAIVRRAFDLGIIDAAQYRTANIYLVRTGQTKSERYDDDMPLERPELLSLAMDSLHKKGLHHVHRVAAALNWGASMFELLTERPLPQFDTFADPKVIPIRN